MVSLVCCYNNISQYKQLKESLNTQEGVIYELIGVDNRNNKFFSAAHALNYGAEQSKGEWLIFLHQDIEFLDKYSLKNFCYELFKMKEESGILGLYGNAYRPAKTNTQLNIADTLDECFVGMNKTLWEQYKFNTDICDGWHLYVVELCIRVRQKDCNVYFKDFSIKHLSSGTVNKAYMKTFRRLMCTYKNEKWICTTCKTMPNISAVYYLYYMMWIVKKTVLGNYPLMYKIQKREN